MHDRDAGLRRDALPWGLGSDRFKLTQRRLAAEPLAAEPLAAEPLVAEPLAAEPLVAECLGDFFAACSSQNSATVSMMRMPSFTMSPLADPNLRAGTRLDLLAGIDYRPSGKVDGLRLALEGGVPVYQELARRIGPERMRANLSAMPYGNAEIGNEVDTFWLKGPLQISAIEQTKYLARLALGELPFSAEAQQSVREIVKIEQGDGWVLYAKTGWTTTPDPDIGWWVGWVEKDAIIFSFALNIDMPDRALVAKRVELGKASLKALGLF